MDNWTTDDEILLKNWHKIRNRHAPELGIADVVNGWYDITHAPSRSTVSPTISEINSPDNQIPNINSIGSMKYDDDSVWVRLPAENSEMDDRHALHAKMVELLKQTHPALYAAILDRAASVLWPIEKTVIDEKETE